MAEYHSIWGAEFHEGAMTVLPGPDGLSVIVADNWVGVNEISLTLTDEQAEALEVALYRYRIARTFDRKDQDADGLEGTRPELEGRAAPPPGA